MNRETVIAIGFGIGLGVIVGVVILYQTSTTEEAKVIPITRESNQKKVIADEVSLDTSKNNLTLTSPNNNSIVAKNSTEIIGTVKSNSLIVIQSATAEIVEKNEKENFNIKIPLTVGENVIQVSTYSDTSSPQEQVLRIYYIPVE